MSNGNLIVCGDYAGDLEGIAEVLNSLGLDIGWDKDERFVVVDGRIKSNRHVLENAGAMPYCSHEQGEDEPRYQADLEALRDAIAPLLTSGTLELVSESNIRGRVVILKRLSFRSNGWAQSEWQQYDNFPVNAGKNCYGYNRDWYVYGTETVEPAEQFEFVPFVARDSRPIWQCQFLE
jgi:hypothetical protein